MPLPYHFGIAGHNHDSCFSGSLRHAFDNSFKLNKREPLFKHKSGTKIHRFCSTDRQIVDGTVNCKFPDITSGKKNRTHDIGIGGIGGSSCRKIKLCLIVKKVEKGIVQMRHEYPLHERLR